MATLLGHFEDSNGNILFPINGGETSNIEAGSISSQAYTKGMYLFYDNKLCKATTAIASGNTLAIGTNLVQVTLGSEISSHLVASNGTAFTFQNFLDGVYDN